MPKNGANISLSSFDDIFSTDESRNVVKNPADFHFRTASF